MSDCRFLNDRKELAHALESFVSRFDGESGEALKMAMRWWSHYHGHCVFSLSKSPEILSQWRAYADDGRGLALGFNERFLTSPWCGYKARLVDCVYENHEYFIDEIAESLAPRVDELAAVYKQCRKAANAYFDELRGVAFPIEDFFSEIMRIKNSAFIEEQEVRLVVSPTFAETKTRVSSGIAIPYIEHEVWPSRNEGDLDVLIPEVVAGPRFDERNMMWLKSRRFLAWVEGIRTFECGYR
ncbi:DUF2971 domain-containing protein [Chromohalobacter canadensis]|uniref:DUF2971 domain-containing protein n=1 Tax=Chromohalobacter canadensis TaxID=141389 RepID=UPI0021C0F82A|nr:DUF2971 domain-containing protein [Chromohalobacter canadensis]MCT8467812.1 DUF2971 domain-containing protein [Chromohalobacter canadensis]MCT8470440.1 DUF2971 domain-containing protein [Chromohalobacter canadensis]MCT8498309.1 DUF2971 domain-containing protein [Chromohalobacter canadensis]